MDYKEQYSIDNLAQAKGEYMFKCVYLKSAQAILEKIEKRGLLVLRRTISGWEVQLRRRCLVFDKFNLLPGGSYVN